MPRRFSPRTGPPIRTSPWRPSASARVCSAGLYAVDRLRLPAYLETSADGNVRFYQRHGFEVTAAVDMPDGGPRTWCMRRMPGPAR